MSRPKLEDLPHVLVGGTRTFADYELLCSKLDAYTAELERLVVVTGAAKGADTLAEKWAADRRHHVMRFHADWAAHGKKAGPIRNAEMAAYVAGRDDRWAVFFWDGTSPGTRDCVTRCKAAGIPTKVVRYGDR